ncbi:MAG: alpha/beta hydrolase [Candidatus Binatus sp.]|uniref:alpha/beta fold hydrolase n=1 Tax=Candidatus Binatus sp. TaxID=2811406 RepID=UPI002726A18A|nr:alpha/beta hydrolase [Candidatus Binatus sp.]MDO8432762.1 alpha/beta hydrolase [Candidatus Binatus sp.]
MDARLKVTGGFAPSGDGQIYFETAGRGPALIFVHAGVSDRRMWDPQFEAFAAEYQVIRLDLRGFGKSRMTQGPYANRDDLASVLDAIGVTSAVLVGCSMGGATAIDFTLEHPETVSALVLVGAGVSGWKDWSPQTFNHFGQMMRLIQQGDSASARDLEARYWIDGPSRDAAKVDSAYRARAAELHRENFSVERFSHQEQELSPPAIGRLGEIKCPATVIIGDSDADDIRALGARLATEIAGARLVTIENGAHLPNLEHPDRFNRILREFLARLAN